MNSRINVGDRIVCEACFRSTEVTADMVARTCERLFPSRVPAELLLSDLSRFQCSECRSRKAIALRTNRDAPRTPYEGREWDEAPSPVGSSDAYASVSWDRVESVGTRAGTRKIFVDRAERADPFNALGCEESDDDKLIP